MFRISVWEKFHLKIKKTWKYPFGSPSFSLVNLPTSLPLLVTTIWPCVSPEVWYWESSRSYNGGRLRWLICKQIYICKGKSLANMKRQVSNENALYRGFCCWHKGPSFTQFRAVADMIVVTCMNWSLLGSSIVVLSLLSSFFF